MVVFLAVILLLIVTPALSGETRIYDDHQNLKYRIEDNGHIYDNNLKSKGRIEKDRVYDENLNLKYRIDKDRVYDKDYDLKYRIEGDRIYDKNWKSQGRIDKRK